MFYNTYFITKSEKRIIALSAQGYSDKQIAYIIGVKRGTFHMQKHRLCRNLGVHNMAQAIHEIHVVGRFNELSKNTTDEEQTVQERDLRSEEPPFRWNPESSFQ